MPKKTIEDLAREGWKFEYSKHTRFVEGSHPKGGRFSVCELYHTSHVDADDLGNIIAHALNSWGAAKEGPPNRHNIRED